MLANNETSVIDEICESRAIRMLVEIRTEFSVITGWRILTPLLLYSSKRASESATPVQTHEPEFPWSPSHRKMWQRSGETEAKRPCLPLKAKPPVFTVRPATTICNEGRRGTTSKFYRASKIFSRVKVVALFWAGSQHSDYQSLKCRAIWNLRSKG